MSAVTVRAGLLRRLARYFNPTRPEIAANLLLAATDLDRLDRADQIARVRAELEEGTCKRAGCDNPKPPKTGRRGRPAEYCTDHNRVNHA